MLKSNGIHHLAIMTADMKAHVDFWSDVLGAKLVAMYYMHGTDGYFSLFYGAQRPSKWETCVSCSICTMSRYRENPLGGWCDARW